MSKLDLLPHEVILKRDSSITYDPNGRRSVPNAELLLTNLALIVVAKGMFGGTKEIIRFPLETISRDHGRARVQEGKSKNGERQLHVFFPYGVESFTLGEADVENDDPGAVLKNLFTSQAEKERRNLQEWRNAIITAAHEIDGTALRTSNEPSAETRGFIDAMVATVGAGVSAVTHSGSTAKPAQKVQQNKTQRCIGCGAPLSGCKGERVVCRYCDTEQAIG